MRRPDGTLAIAPRLVLLAAVALGLVVATADPFTVLFYGSYVAVGVLLVVRRPSNLVSWLLVGIAFAFLGTTSRPSVDIVALQAGNAGPVDELQAWVAAWIAPAAFLGYGALAFVFPAGSLPEGRWRRVAVVAIGLATVTTVLTMFEPSIALTPSGGAQIVVPNPIGVLPGSAVWDLVGPAGFVVTLGALGFAIVNLLVRYRRASDLLRLQLRWLVAALALVLFAIVFGLSVVLLHGDDAGGFAWIPAIVAYPAVPLAIGVAVLRYRLYEIDRIVNRALVYGTMTAILAGVFAAATALSQRLFVQIAGTSSDLSPVLTTLVVVTVYAPVRKRVEAVIDRYFKYDRREYGPYLDELRRLLDLVEPGRAAARLVREALAQTRATGVAVLGADGSILASAGEWPGEPVVTVPLAVDGSPLGAILVGPRRDGRPHPAGRIRALAEVAAMAARGIDPGRPVVRATLAAGISEPADARPAAEEARTRGDHGAVEIGGDSAPFPEPA